MSITVGPMDFDQVSRTIVDQHLLELNQTDAGLAESFKYLFGLELRYVKEKGQWVRYVGHFWRPADELAQLRMLQTVRSIRQTAFAFLEGDQHNNVRNRIVRWTYECEANSRLTAALTLSQSFLAETINDFDRNKMLFGVENKVIDLRTGQPLEPKPEQCITKIGGARHIGEMEYIGDDGEIDTPYYDEDTGRYMVPGTEAPRWEQFLNEVFAGDQDLIRFVQRAVGYTLTGDTSENGFFILYGLGANGKSVFLNVIERLMGDYGLTAPTSVFMERRAGDAAPTNEIARMAGARFVKSIEVPERANFDIERMKALTGGERISARYLYHESFEFHPVAKIWMAVNHRPLVNDPTYSFWRRAFEIPFNVTFPKEKQDKYLIDKLYEELPGILQWAIAGCLMWQKEGLGNSQAVEKATKDYQDSTDSVGGFLDEMTEPNLIGSVKSSTFYQAYHKWCDDNGFSPVTHTTLSVTMKVRGFEKIKTMEGARFRGLLLKPRDHEVSNN